MKNFYTNFYALIYLHELDLYQFKIRVIRLIVEDLKSIRVKILKHKIPRPSRTI